MMRVYKALSGFARLCKALEGFIRVYKALQGFRRVYKGSGFIVFRSVGMFPLILTVLIRELNRNPY